MNSSKTIPQHIAIIMDGNGRWAQEKGLARHKGHQEGAKVVKEIVKESRKMGVKFLTLYTFSSENWARPKIEIKALMKLLESYLRNEVEELAKQGVVLNTIGDISLFPKSLQKLLAEAKSYTANNSEKAMVLTLALSYGGREEIVDACQLIAQDVLDKKLDIKEIDDKCFSSKLYTSSIPDPELMIRTSNEHRLSNFLLWQMSYAEFVFVKENWPDFNAKIFRDCINEYQNRDRRFGKVK